MELIIGPSLALIVSMFFATASGKKNESQITELAIQVEKLEGKIIGMTKANDIKLADIEKQNLEKMMKIMVPMASSVNQLNQTVGL